MPDDIEMCEDSECVPDEGLELREDFALKLEASIRAVEAGEPTIPAEELARRHNLFWEQTDFDITCT